ncbi:MAG: LysR family transcriptional regulator [Burkholderiaceae bacterium]
MDLNLVRTFLEVCQTRHFGRAAEHLHLTGSAVSARIKTLEDQLGAPLFLRLRNGIELTPTAERLVTQFRSMMATWDQVRFLVSVESAPRPNLTLAASSGVWTCLDPGWVRQLTDAQPDLMLRLETHPAAEVLRRLQQGSVDLGITFEQLLSPELVSTQIGELRLTLMSDQADTSVAAALQGNYLHIDWSTSFNTRFQSAFPEFTTGRITVSNATIAANILAQLPAAAYLSGRIIDRLRASMALHPVPGAPEICIPVFASHMGATAKRAVIDAAIGWLVGANHKGSVQTEPGSVGSTSNQAGH